MANLSLVMIGPNAGSVQQATGSIDGKQSYVGPWIDIRGAAGYCWSVEVSVLSAAALDAGYTVETTLSSADSALPVSAPALDSFNFVLPSGWSVTGNVVTLAAAASGALTHTQGSAVSYVRLRWDYASGGGASVGLSAYVYVAYPK